jgi:hypothetical protein
MGRSLPIGACAIEAGTAHSATKFTAVQLTLEIWRNIVILRFVFGIEKLAEPRIHAGYRTSVSLSGNRLKTGSMQLD